MRGIILKIEKAVANGLKIHRLGGFTRGRVLNFEKNLLTIR